MSFRDKFEYCLLIRERKFFPTRKIFFARVTIVTSQLYEIFDGYAFAVASKISVYKVMAAPVILVPKPKI